MKIKSLLFAVTSSLLLYSCATIDKPTPNAADQPFDLFPGEDTIPIMSWYSIPPADLSVERFIELKEAGFNLNFSHIYGLADAKKALDCAQQAGIRNLFMCGALIGKPEELLRPHAQRLLHGNHRILQRCRRQDRRYRHPAIRPYRLHL